MDDAVILDVVEEAAEVGEPAAAEVEDQLR